MNINFDYQEIEDLKLAVLLAIKQLDMNTTNNADMMLSDRLEIMARRLDDIV